MNRLLPAGMRRKGEPVWVLVAIVGGWIGVRAAIWDRAAAVPVADPGWERAAPLHASGHRARVPLVMTPPSGGGAGPGQRAARGMGSDLAPYLAGITDAAGRPAAMMSSAGAMVAEAGGQELLWLAALARMPLSHDVAGHAAVLPLAAPVQAAPVGGGAPRAAMWLDAPAASPPAVAGGGGAALPRWSGDGWLLLRQGGNRAGSGLVLLPGYGANQAGAVLRYRLAPASGYRPTVYARAYGALNGTGEREVAAGLSARPIPALPVAAMAEGRVSHFAGGSSHLRPAFALVTELPPVLLPGGLRAETYAQGGYVGGLGATLFVDGQFRLEHVVHHAAHAEWRVGGGLWGGAQRGAGRMDIGPTATVAFSTARAGAHVSFDWRLRVAGNARPGSGPAVTLAAGF